jgi:hypothetical protein
VELFHQPEVEQLHDVMLAALPAEHDVGRLDVPVNEAHRVRLTQRPAQHRQNPHDAAGSLRSVDRHDPLQRRAVE